VSIEHNFIDICVDVTKVDNYKNFKVTYLSCGGG